MIKLIKGAGMVMLGCFLILVGILYLLVRDRGLSESVKQDVNRRRGELTQLANELKLTKEKLKKASAEDPALVAPFAKREGWDSSLSEVQSWVKANEKAFNEELQPLIKKNKSADQDKIYAKLQRFRVERGAYLTTLKTIGDRPAELKKLIQGRGERLATARQDLAKLQTLTQGAVRKKAEDAKRDWPAQATVIDVMISTLDGHVTKAKGLVDELEQMANVPLEQLDVAKLYQNFETVHTLAGRTQTEVQNIEHQLDELYISRDKILADMELTEGYEVTFKHLYKTVVVDRSNKPQITEKWTSVSKQLYMSNEKNLGMVLESKPKGKFPNQKTKIATPPGFSYVGDSHYGEWASDEGGRYWRWHRDHQYMRTSYWGPNYSYRPIYYNQWDTYRGYYSSGRPYYGSSRLGTAAVLFGTAGVVTAGAYAYSKYKRNKGYKSSKFWKSGGKYRGTRYSGSRSSGYRSSGYRSGYRRGYRSYGGSRSFGK